MKAFIKALVVLLVLSFSSFGQVPSPPDPIKIPSSTARFSGCINDGKVCFAPNLAITIAALNLKTKKIEATFSPGVGYGMTYHPGVWYSVGMAGHFTMDPGTQQASVSLLGSFFNGYLHFGVSKSFLNDNAWRLVIAPGTAIAF